ncbi:MAG: cysteine--tRNA ligase [Xanthobacteraceae bacterium]
MELRLYDTLAREKRVFTPLDPANVRMYVCGPTVYDFAHIGNARPVIVFDVLFRLLRHLYGADHVTYVRNITDVDDKIIDRAKQNLAERGQGGAGGAGGGDLNAEIRKLTEETYANFKQDVAALGCLSPTVEPRATEYIHRSDGKLDMITMIERLIASGHAYAADGHVLFDVPSMPDYGRLSKRPLDEMIAGARVEVAPYKRNPTDFVLWKPSSPDEPGWDSPWGRGRPGWHIECSAMSGALLGETFDIHGGGIDLVFPHHENEIAQSRCAFHTPVMANYWMHNGFLMVEGEKMAKSLGNFITIRELLETDKFDDRPWQGETLRLSMLKTHYRQPIDWTSKALREAAEDFARWHTLLADSSTFAHLLLSRSRGEPLRPHSNVIEALCDDLNTPAALSELFKLAGEARANQSAIVDFVDSAEFLGILNPRKIDVHEIGVLGINLGPKKIMVLEDEVTRFRVGVANSSPQMIDNALSAFEEAGVVPEYDRESGNITLKGKQQDAQFDKVEALIADRAAARARKDFKEADRIRDELLAMGIVLKDGKDPVTGKLKTEWEVAR